MFTAANIWLVGHRKHHAVIVMDSQSMLHRMDEGILCREWASYSQTIKLDV